MRSTGAAPSSARTFGARTSPTPSPGTSFGVILQVSAQQEISSLQLRVRHETVQCGNMKNEELLLEMWDSILI